MQFIVGLKDFLIHYVLSSYLTQFM